MLLKIPLKIQASMPLEIALQMQIPLQMTLQVQVQFQMQLPLELLLKMLMPLQTPNSDADTPCTFNGMSITTCMCVLVSAGTELTLFLVAGTVLCFGFSVRMMLITL